MEIGSIAHKGVRRLVDDDDPSKVDPRVATKLLLIVGFLQEMSSLDDLKTAPKWRAHTLAGDRAGTWSLNVTRNWRLTFRVDSDNLIQDLDLEDYH